MSCVTIIMPKKVGIKVADKLKLPSLFRAHGAPTWIQAISICKPPIGPQPILLGLKSSIYFSPAILGLALMPQSELWSTLEFSKFKDFLLMMPLPLTWDPGHYFNATMDE